MSTGTLAQLPASQVSVVFGLPSSHSASTVHSGVTAEVHFQSGPHSMPTGQSRSVAQEPRPVHAPWTQAPPGHWSSLVQELLVGVQVPTTQIRLVLQSLSVEQVAPAPPGPSPESHVARRRPAARRTPARKRTGRERMIATSCARSVREYIKRSRIGTGARYQGFATET